MLLGHQMCSFFKKKEKEEACFIIILPYTVLQLIQGLSVGEKEKDRVRMGEGTHIHMGAETVCQGSTLYHASTNSWLACVFFIMHDDFSHILAASFFLF